jgi:hypothetical protein
MYFVIYFFYLGRTGSGSKTALLGSDDNTSNRKKSILKKSDSTNQSKEETEKLLLLGLDATLDKQTTTSALSSLTPSHSTPSTISTSRPTTEFLRPQIFVPADSFATAIDQQPPKNQRPTLKQLGSSKSWKQQAHTSESQTESTHHSPHHPILLPHQPYSQPPTGGQTTRLIGAVTPIQLTSKMSLKKNEIPNVRCSNPCCFYNKVSNATPLCAGCGYRMETLNVEHMSSKQTHSVPLSPSTPDAKPHRQSSNESAPPCS